MKYKVHRLDIRMEEDRAELEQFLNSLEGEVIAVIPDIKLVFLMMGATARINFLYNNRKDHSIIRP